MIWAVLMGIAAGVLTGAGVGGGTLLLIYLTQGAGMAQLQAQGVNLLYFLITAPAALWGHFQNGLVEKSIALEAGLVGAAAAAGAAWLSTGMDGGSLRQIFGLFTLLVGIRELLARPAKK